MTSTENVQYTAKTRTSGGRDGSAHSNDGRLDVRLTVPGTIGTGTNPEQMLAAGWSACLLSGMVLAARKLKVSIPSERFIDAEVDLCRNRDRVRDALVCIRDLHRRLKPSNKQDSRTASGPLRGRRVSEDSSQ